MAARPAIPSIPWPDGTRIRAVADPVIEGRSLVLEAIRSLGIACRAWAAYPSDHPNVTQAVDAAQARVGGMLSAHGSVAIGVARSHLRVGVWTLESAQARALAQALISGRSPFSGSTGASSPRSSGRSCSGSRARRSPSSPGRRQRGRLACPGARHLHLQPLDYSAVRLDGQASEATAAAAGVVSLSDRLLNVVLEWGSAGRRGWDWESDQPATGAAVPAEVAMVGLAPGVPQGTGRTRASRAGRR